MVITEVNLKELMEQYQIAPIGCYDTFSITLHLSRFISKYCCSGNNVITYGQKVNDDELIDEEITDEYILKPGQAILACSNERIKMPEGYIGFLQTKGSLARLFITAHCCDGQIEPGFEGCVTFELCNMGDLNVKLLPYSPIAQLFVFKTSSYNEKYNGKYSNSDKPTYSK